MPAPPIPMDSRPSSTNIPPFEQKNEKEGTAASIERIDTIEIEEKFANVTCNDSSSSIKVTSTSSTILMEERGNVVCVKEEEEVMEEVRLRQQPSPFRIAPTSTPINTGHLKNLSGEQREALFQLWEMVIDFLATSTTSSDSSTYTKTNKKTSQANREVAMEDLRKSQTRVHFRSVYELSDEEASAIERNPISLELFSQCSTDDPDTTLLRFLRARKWIVADAFAMLTDCLKWRKSVGVRSLMEQGEEGVKRDLLAGGKNYFWKEDREGRLVCYIRSRLHDKSAQTLEESIHFTIYTVEVGRRLRRHDEQLVTAVFDLRDAPFASLDIPCMQFMVSTLQSFYPEILGKCLILDAPWIFSGFWKICKSLLDPVVAAKIEFISLADLPKYIDANGIPKEYGGNDPFEFHYEDPLPPREPVTEESAEMAEKAELLLARLTIIRTRFLECTREMHSLISRVEDPKDLELLLVPLREQRDELKDQLRDCYKEMDKSILPPTWYHRIGVLDEDGAVDWDQYRGKGSVHFGDNEKLRRSAPPTFPSS